MMQQTAQNWWEDARNGFISLKGVSYQEVHPYVLQILRTLPRNMAFSDICRMGSIEIAEGFLDFYPSLNVYEQADDTYNSAILSSNFAFVQWFIARFPQINVRSFGRIELINTAENGDLDTLKWLLGLSSNVRAKIRADEDVLLDRVCNYFFLGREIIYADVMYYLLTFYTADEFWAMHDRINSLSRMLRAIHRQRAKHTAHFMQMIAPELLARVACVN